MPTNRKDSFKRLNLPTLPSIQASLSPFNRPPLISAPYVLGALPTSESLQSVAHPVEATSPLGVRSQHASFVAYPSVAGSNIPRQTHVQRQDVYDHHHSQNPHPHHSPVQASSYSPTSPHYRGRGLPGTFPTAPGRAPPDPRAPSDEVETLHTSQYSSEEGGNESDRPRYYGLSDEDIEEFEALGNKIGGRAERMDGQRVILTPGVLKEGKRRRSKPMGKGETPVHKPQRDTVATVATEGTGRSSYPINIDEWAVSPLPERRHFFASSPITGALPPSFASSSHIRDHIPSAHKSHSTPHEAAIGGSQQRDILVIPSFSDRATSAFTSSLKEGAELGRSNSFPRSAVPSRNTPRRAPPPSLKLVKSNSSLARPEAEWVGTQTSARRNSDDSVGVGIEAEHRYPVPEQYPTFAARAEAETKGPDEWNRNRPDLQEVTLTPAHRSLARSLSRSHSRSDGDMKPMSTRTKSGLIGILKDVGNRSSTWIRQPKKTVRVASPRSSTWASSVLPSPVYQCKTTPSKAEYNLGVYQDPQIKKKTIFRMNWLVVVCLMMVIILATVIPIKMVQKDHQDRAREPPTTSGEAPTRQGAPVPTEVNDCLALFNSQSVGARNGVLYPCSVCVPILERKPNDFLTGNSTGVGQVLQFCALADLLFASPVSMLHGAGWGVGSPCVNWTGVACDERGRVTSLELEYPLVPSTLPNTLTNLVSLTSLRVVGDGRKPTGQLPPSFNALSNLTTLDIEYTAMTGNIKSANLTKSLKSLTLVSNPGLEFATADLGTSSLQTLILSDQNLTSVPNLPATLEFLDLSHNALSGPMTSFIALPMLETLYLQYNNLTRFVSPRVSNITTISLEGNTNLTGWMWPSMCEKLTECDLRGTAMAGENNCSVCFFRG